MWDLYSIGDSAFLAAVLNSVAMIAGTGAIGQLAGIGFLLAILLTAFQGLMAENGPRFPYQHVFVAAVIYMLMYGPRRPGSLSRMRTAARCGSWITCRHDCGCLWVWHFPTATCSFVVVFLYKDI